MYVPIALHFSDQELAALGAGHPVKVTKAHLGGAYTTHVTRSQYKRLQKIQSGLAKFMRLKMSAAQFKRNVKHGHGVFGDAWKFIKNNAHHATPLLKKGAQMAFDKLAPIAANKIGNMVEKYTGSGFNNEIYNTGPRRLPAKKPKKRAFQHEVYNTGAHRTLTNAEVAKVLRNAGFQKHHVQYMKGSGFFGDLWSGIKSGVSSIAKHAIPLLGQIAVKKLGGGIRPSKKLLTGLGFKKHHFDHMAGSGFFSDIMGGIGSVAKAVAPIAVPVASSFLNRGRGQAGAGFFSDLIGGIGSVANAVAPIAVPVASSFLNRGRGKKKGGSARPVGSRGGSAYPVGSF